MVVAVDGPHDELPVIGERHRVAHQRVATGELDADPRPDRRRPGSEFVRHPRRVDEPGRQCSQQRRQETVAVAGTTTLDDRGRPWLPGNRPDVDTDPDHDTRLGPGDELGEDPRQLPGRATVHRHQVVGPLRQDRRRAECVGCGSGRRADGPDHCACLGLAGRYPKAHEQRVAGIVVPRAIEATPSCRLVIGDEDRAGRIAASRLVGQIGIGRPGRRDVAEGPGADVGCGRPTHRQKASSGCRMSGVHSTNH